VTGVALITFILLAVHDPKIQVSLLVWIFIMRVAMLLSSAAAYFINGAIAKAKYQHADEMDYETPLTSLVWITSILSIAMTYVVSYLMIPNLGDGTIWWKLASIISCGTLAGAIIPELVKVFTSTKSAHVRDVVTSAKEGGASLGILSGFVAGNFSAYWLGLCMVALMGTGYFFSLGIPNLQTDPAGLMLAPAVFAFGLVAFGFLGMGPVTIAVDSYGPVTDNAQSVYELSLIETIPGIQAEVKKDFGFDANFDRAKDLLEANDGAGNTFKATAKPVLIGTAVVGATTMVFSIIMALTDGLTHSVEKLSLLHAPFLLVHGRFHPGSLDRRLPRGGVHQGQHQAGRRGEGLGIGLEEGCRDLHAVCAEGHVQHLPGRLLRDAGLRVPGAVPVHRLPDLNCHLRPLSGDFHGQRGRRLG
jgi:K(+)-stimulated pyrophosphate-energized sodium pump